MHRHDHSERFIHDELLRRAKTGLPTIVTSWRQNGKIEPFLISWPAEHLEADDGKIITEAVLCTLPDDRAEWRGRIQQLIGRTNPFALLLGEQRLEEVVAIFESPHGTMSWHWPIKNQGGVKVLGDRYSREDVESISLLWRATKVAG